MAVPFVGPLFTARAFWLDACADSDDRFRVLVCFPVMLGLTVYTLAELAGATLLTLGLTLKRRVPGGPVPGRPGVRSADPWLSVTPGPVGGGPSFGLHVVVSGL